MLGEWEVLIEYPLVYGEGCVSAELPKANPNASLAFAGTLWVYFGSEPFPLTVEITEFERDSHYDINDNPHIYRDINEDGTVFTLCEDVPNVSVGIEGTFYYMMPCEDIVPKMCGKSLVTFSDKCSTDLSIYVKGENVLHIPDVDCDESKITVLYEDGTLIVNELYADREYNISVHGNLVEEWMPWTESTPYNFDVAVGYGYLENKWVELIDLISPRPWENQNVTKVMFGSYINPSNMNGWFARIPIQSIDWTNCDLSECTSMIGTFAFTNDLVSIDIPSLVSILSVQHMFEQSGLKNIRMCGTSSANIAQCVSMFIGCKSLETITTDIDFSTAIQSDNMFYLCESIVGGNGTTYDPSHVDNSYAVIDTAGMQGYLTSC